MLIAVSALMASTTLKKRWRKVMAQFLRYRISEAGSGQDDGWLIVVIA
jgi:hypothetical protein